MKRQLRGCFVSCLASRYITGSISTPISAPMNRQPNGRHAEELECRPSSAPCPAADASIRRCVSPCEMLVGRARVVDLVEVGGVVVARDRRAPCPARRCSSCGVGGGGVRGTVVSAVGELPSASTESRASLELQARSSPRGHAHIRRAVLGQGYPHLSQPRERATLGRAPRREAVAVTRRVAVRCHRRRRKPQPAEDLRPDRTRRRHRLRPRLAVVGTAPLSKSESSRCRRNRCRWKRAASCPGRRSPARPATVDTHCVCGALVEPRLTNAATA